MTAQHEGKRAEAPGAPQSRRSHSAHRSAGAPWLSRRDERAAPRASGRAPTWILEQDVFDPEMIVRLSDACERAGARVLKVDLMSDGETVGPAPKIDGPAVAYGSVAIRAASRRYGCAPGVWTSPELAAERYRDQLGGLYLNADLIRAPFLALDEVAEERGWSRIFVKPVDDDKLFGGRVLGLTEAQAWCENMLKIGYIDTPDIDAVVAPARPLGREWRCIAVNGQVVAASQYRGPNGAEQSRGAPASVRELAEMALKRFSPVPVLAVDVAEDMTSGEPQLKVVEYNTFNSADFYACDPAPIVAAVNALLQRATHGGSFSPN